MQDTFSTPMMKQYSDIKKHYTDCMLFYRMGDFYELFLEDAHIGARVLNITLTGKANGKGGRIPMAGVPYHSVDTYLAKLVKAGSDFVFQLHYTATGKAGTDRSRIGVIFAKERPKERVFTSNATNSKFVIPPGDPAFRVVSSITVQQSARLVDLMPHMHYRGKDFEYRAVYPTGEEQTLLSVPKYDFNWQLLYQFKDPLFLPKGTRLDCVAHFDNSAKNKYNPDPGKEVRWGDQTWEEMMIGWFDYILDKENLTERASTK